MKKIAVHNLGCKVNSYELDVMVQELKDNGYELVSFDEPADIYVVNTCTVTNIADRKSRQMLHRTKKLNPDSITVAVGCYVETDRKRIEEDPSIDLAIGNNKKSRIADIIKEYLDERADGTGLGKTLGGRTMENINEAPKFESMHLETSGRTRADIKIQDGCNQFCTYCIIPYARGRIRSRNPEEIIEEIKHLAAKGTKEVVLTGIHICSYGKDLGQDPEEALLSLLTRINMLAGIERIRLGSLEPRIMTENFVRSISGLSKLCPHFHLSLQSGCDETLKRMNRHYTADEFYEGVQLLRKYYDRPAITTDVIVGFPGETEEDFKESADFCRKVNFYEMHVFKYSIRHGTPAAKMPGQLTDAQKSTRSDVLLNMTAVQSDEYRKSFIGEQEEIVLEEPIKIDTETYYPGFTGRYIECIVSEEDLKAVLKETDSPHGFMGMSIKGTVTEAVSKTPYLRLRHLNV